MKDWRRRRLRKMLVVVGRQQVRDVESFRGVVVGDILCGSLGALSLFGSGASEAGKTQVFGSDAFADA